MTTSHYERLPFLDSTFLALESAETPMHVGATIVFEAGPLRTPEGGVDIDRIRGFVEAALQYIPRYRQRLEWIPLERHPVWVDDEHFRLERHVRHTALPHPGTEEQLRAFAGHVFGQRLDRGKPLWEVWVVEGLDGDRFALVSKVHHCMIDGIAGVDLLKVLLSPIPDPVVSPADHYEPRPAPTPAQLVVDEAFRRLQGFAAASVSLARFLEEGREVSDEVCHRLEAIVQSIRSGWFSNVSSTPINGDIGPNRRVAWISTDLDEVKRIKNSLGGTVNDVVIAVIAGALRRFFTEDRGITVDGGDIRAMVPVSLRGDRGTGELGNQITMWLIDLPVAEPDPASRLKSVIASTTRSKEGDEALGAATLTQTMSWTPGTLLSVAARLAASTMRPFNLTITNVPGPQIPLYLLGAPMVANYPMVPLWASHGVGFALFSYAGKIDWGLASDFDLVPDVDRLAGQIRAELDALLAAADEAAAAAGEATAVGEGAGG
jgi:WS/DGAT/MGAT family acyltransferase